MSQKVGLKKTTKATTKQELLALSKEELVDKILALQAHNVQLKNLLGKSNEQKSKSVVSPNKQQRAFNFTKHSFRHVLLRIYYLGWDYHGFVVQEDTTNTIEHHLFNALLKTCLIESRATSNYHRCGRTDKGVSSFGQVISIDLRSKLSPEHQGNLTEEINYCQLLNRVLPESIQCTAWMPVDVGFSARFDCKFRCYKYFFPCANLKIDKMQKACKYLIGTHDFRNLCKMDVANGVTEFVRSIDDATVRPINPHEFDDRFTMIVFCVKSKGFLWHQIRCIMGVLFLIGEEREEPEIIKELMDISKNPSKPDYKMASELPLNLFDCEYDCNNFKWHYNTTAIKAVLQTLHGQWTNANVKSTMLKEMLLELEGMASIYHPELHGLPFTNVLNHDNKSKQHVPLINRPKCDSLDTKVEHYLKRQKLEIKPPEETASAQKPSTNAAH